MVWQSAIDLSSLVAIDVHVHAGRSAAAPAAETGPTRDDTLARSTQRMGVGGQTPDETAAYYRERNMDPALAGRIGGQQPRKPNATASQS